MRNSLNQTEDKKVVIMGAGPAGLTAAYCLSQNGVPSLVLEKDSVVGGLSRTIKYKNYYFDLGGHRFFTDIPEVEEIWRKVLGPDILRRNRLSRIYFNKKLFYYPLRPFNSLRGLGLWNVLLIQASFLYSRVFPSKKEETFEEWVTNRFGKRLYHTFFKSYTEKILGIPCNELRAEWAAQRIEGLSLLKAMGNAFKRGGNNGNGQPCARTLTQSFLYPKYGPGMMWEAMAGDLGKKGNELSMETEVVEIPWNRNRVTSLLVNQNRQEKEIHASQFISSIPLKDLLEKFNPKPPEETLKAVNALRYRDFITLALIVNKRDVFPDQWLYIHDQGLKLGRIQNFKNWSPFMIPDPDKTCLGLEYFCSQGDEVWSLTDEELIQLGKKELEVLGFAQADEVEDASIARVPNAYPIYDSKYQDSRQALSRFLAGIENLHLVGRNGLHRYNNMDHSMFTAMMAVENILGANHNLWEL